MEEHYVKKEISPLEFVTNGKAELAEVFTKGRVENLEVTILKDFTDAVKASQKLNEMEKKQIRDFIEDNMDIVKEGLESWIEGVEGISSAERCIQKMFSGLSELATFSENLVEILRNLNIPG
ncbi:hypothetical protein Shal_1344 [Shewanella halifaxensis HAW-EB4]|uniref:Uncharacterized protein n=1 Tax=Shewanella halifaxensis (strain HAW-EB4) TaxID=458817 RepID=B0TLG1_SHEHH|nr:hypothetical protein [Shewanella halifaxensis]ABZ75911.1 hypothetical protein Shal_1344 [Shewanella halifaxensis HAW-EB4]